MPLRLFLGASAPHNPSASSGYRVCGGISGFVLQDTVLFRGAVAENIAYGRPTASAREIMEAAQLANAHEFIRRMPQGYQTMVGERGMTLSGGQRQRIGIARGFIGNSPVLILDEPTAALDVEAEGRVMEGLMRFATQSSTGRVAP